MAQDGPTTTAEEPSLGELVAAASRDLSVLIRSEIALAKTEVRVEVGKAAAGGVAFGGAAFLGLFAFGLLSFAAVYGLAKAPLPLWSTFLIVGGSYLLVAGALAMLGVLALKRLGPPERTLRTAKETVGVLKDRGRGVRANAQSGT